jgi:hypothetical protein
MYNRTSEHAFPLSSGSDAARFPGETHIGFTLGFDDLWPQLRDALEAEVAPQAGAAKPPGSRMAAVTITGHSQGAALATLLSYAVGGTQYSVARRAAARACGCWCLQPAVWIRIRAPGEGTG